MVTFLYVVYVMVCMFLILVVLLQAGRGGGMGTALGGGSQTVFGGSGAGNFLTRLTVISAALFMLLSAALTYVSSSGEQSLERASEKVRMREEARSAATADSKKPGDKKAAEVAPAPQSTPEGEQAAAPAEGAAEPSPVPVIIQKADGTPIQLGDSKTGAPIQVQRVDGIGGKPIDAQPVEAPAAPAPAAPAAPAQ
jgi:preprotein translocase subunit SecG